MLDATKIEEILDLASNLAEEDDYGSIGYHGFHSQDHDYIEKAILQLADNQKQEKKAKLISWFGFTRDEFYEMLWQPGEPHWEELTPDEDGDGCEYEVA